TFIRQLISCGRDEFQDRTGAAAPEDITEPPEIDNEALWLMRRDLEGRAPNQPAAMLTPPMECTLGLTLLQLRSSGAAADGHYWLLNNKRIRVLRASNELMHRVEAR